MPFINFVGFWNQFFIPAVVAAFVPTYQKDSYSPWIESVKDPIRITLVLNSQFSHMTIFRPFNCRAVREWKGGAFFLKQYYGSRH